MFIILHKWQTVADSSSYVRLFIYFSTSGEGSTIGYKHLSDSYGILQYICFFFVFFLQYKMHADLYFWQYIIKERTFKSILQPIFLLSTNIFNETSPTSKDNTSKKSTRGHTQSAF